MIINTSETTTGSYAVTPTNTENLFASRLDPSHPFNDLNPSSNSRKILDKRLTQFDTGDIRPVSVEVRLKLP